MDSSAEYTQSKAFARHGVMTRRDILSGIERPLLVLGLLLVTVLIAVRAYKTLYSQAAVHGFSPNQSGSTSREPVGPSQLNPAIPDFRLWSAKRIEAYQTWNSIRNRVTHMISELSG
jgi:hypothetical protein